MNRPVRLTHLAEADVARAQDDYESREPGLGNRFAQEVRTTLTRVSQNPFQYQVVPNSLGSRRAPVLGLDHFEGRSYQGWTHHVVLTAVAFTFLQLERGRPDGPRPTLPTVRGWVSEIMGLLYVIHNRRLLGMLDSFRRNAPLRR